MRFRVYPDGRVVDGWRLAVLVGLETVMWWRAEFLDWKWLGPRPR